MSKDEIIKAIRRCAKKLHRNPSLRDLRLIAGISEQVLYKRFGSLRKALESAGLEATGPGFGLPESTLLLDWARVARKLRKIPSVHEYESSGRFSNMPFHTRYRHWTRIPEAFRNFAAQAGVESEWQDVLKMISARSAKESKALQARLRPRVRKGPILQDRPVYGCPLLVPGLAHAPVNELGVLFAFAMVAHRLGFVVHHIQSGFPDCEAMREMARGQWQRLRIEFEFESRNFLKHRHKPGGCDLIVCWIHNWPQCPDHLEVLELSKILMPA